MPQIDTGIFTNLAFKIASDVKTSLFAHGHKAFGDLERSFKPIIEIRNGSVVITAETLDYIYDLEFGVSPEDMQRKDIDIEKLDKWVKLRRSQGHTTPTANRIIKLWKQKGFELPGAVSYSKTLQSTGAVAFAFDAYQDDYYFAITDNVKDILDKQFFVTKSGTVK